MRLAVISDDCCAPVVIKFSDEVKLLTLDSDVVAPLYHIIVHGHLQSDTIVK